MEAAALGRRDNGGGQHLDVGAGCAMAAGHLLVHLLDCTVQGEVAVLLVHVVGARSAVVANADAEVLDLLWSLLEDLMAK